MKEKRMKALVAGAMFSIVGNIAFAQNVGINSTGAQPDASALLDLTSSDKGFLITRSDTSSINSPAFGLMTLSPVDSCLYMYNGSNWISQGGVGAGCPLGVVPVPSAVVSNLACGSSTNTGTLTDGTVASGASTSVPYSGGNGVSYSGESVLSTGVSGLTATLPAGTLSTGAGSVVYTISGTPSGSGTASFAITLGGQSCTINFVVAPAGPTYPAGTVHCTGTPTLVVDVMNPSTGEIWMDRNLGASQVATSSTDAAAYGDLYQWGRAADGHQCRTSNTTSTNATTDTPSHGDFILEGGSPQDWRVPQNDNLWQGVNGVNNPCPILMPIYSAFPDQSAVLSVV